MIFTETPLTGSYLVTPAPRHDQRGWFARVYDQESFNQIGHTANWVQMNHSMTRQTGTVRGMHFQYPPHAEIKLVRCVAGRIFDVLIDLRAESPTLGHWFGAELSAENQVMMYVPEGFAHGFQTLTPNCEVTYSVTYPYMPDFEAGIRYNDPFVGIDWPLSVTDTSPKDGLHAYLDPAAFRGIEI